MKIVISLGGSVIVPDKMDTGFLLKFKNLIKKHKKHKFAIITGGGKTCRSYQIKLLDDLQKDLIGIQITRLNARLLLFIFGKLAKQKIYTNVKDIIKNFGKKVIVSGGITPGNSTDYICSLIAKGIDADFIVNVSNVRGIYDKDPRKYKNAKMFSELSFKEFKNLFGKGKWKPGQNVIFDQKATRFCARNKIKLVFISKHIKNLDRFLSGKEFIGTVVK